MESGSENGDEASTSETARIYTALAVVLFVFSIFILLGNLLTLISILYFTKRRNTLSLIISALSLTDILHVLGPGAMTLYVFFDVDKDFHALFTLCRVQAWIIVFLRIAASLLVTLMGLDRVFASCLPHFYHKHWKGKILAVIFFTTWIFAAFVATWPLLWLEGFRLSKDSSNAYCMFPYDSVFAAFFVLFLLLLLSVSCFSFYSICITANKESFNTKLSSEGTIPLPTQPGTARVTYTRKLSRMVGLIILIYFLHIVPWMVAITLGLFSIVHPALYGLIALQLPLISGFLNPLIYGITWPPYRRAYIRALKWPCGRCCYNYRGSSSRTRSHTLNSTAATLSANHSFWLSDSFEDEDVDQENAFDVLFGPISHVKPLDFNPEELEMFEQNSKQERPSKLKLSRSQQTPANRGPRNESSNQFQNILDLIDEMTESRKKKGTEIAGSPLTGKRDTSGPADRSSSQAPKNSVHCDAINLSFAGQKSSIDPKVDSCKAHTNGSTVSSSYGACACLGKSKCYAIQRRNRYLDYLVSKQTLANSASEKTVVTEI